MPKLGPSGSVRGAESNLRPYRDSLGKQGGVGRMGDIRSRGYFKRKVNYPATEGVDPYRHRACSEIALRHTVRLGSSRQEDILMMRAKRDVHGVLFRMAAISNSSGASRILKL